MAIDDDDDVARVLRARPRAAVPVGFAERVAARIDADASAGFLDVINWRAWTYGLVPAAAALFFAAWMGVGADSSAESTSTGEWNTGTVASATFLQPTTTGDALLEAVLTGSAGDPQEEPGDVR